MTRVGCKPVLGLQNNVHVGTRCLTFVATHDCSNANEKPVANSDARDFVGRICGFLGQKIQFIESIVWFVCSEESTDRFLTIPKWADCSEKRCPNAPIYLLFVLTCIKYVSKLRLISCQINYLKISLIANLHT